MISYRKIQNGTLTDERRRFQRRPAGIAAAEGEEWLEEVRQDAPDYDPATHRLSPLPDDVHDGIVRVGRQERVALTEEEIGQRKVAEADAADAEPLSPAFLRRLLREDKLPDPASADDATLLEYAELHPAWRWQEFAETDMVRRYQGHVIKCIQSHQPEPQHIPTELPALWHLIVHDPDTGYEVWVQPIGGSGTYSYIDPATGNPYRVIHNGRIWENHHNPDPPQLNVWRPGEFGWTDIGPAD
jgi:hypothetical protein